MVANSEIPTDQLVIPVGSNYETAWTFDDAETDVAADWSGCTAVITLRYARATAVLETLTTENGGVTLESEGNLVMNMSDEYTSALTPSRHGVFDIYVTDSDGEDWRVMEGKFTTSARVGGA